MWSIIFLQLFICRKEIQFFWGHRTLQLKCFCILKFLKWSNFGFQIDYEVYIFSTPFTSSTFSKFEFSPLAIMYLRNFCNFRYLWLLKCCRQFNFIHLKPKVFYCHHCTFLWCLWSLCIMRACHPFCVPSINTS
jgi:hypothetical protein